MRSTAVAAVLASAAMAVPAAAQSVEEGVAIVQQWCSNCHAADVAGRGTDVVPSMGQIAVTTSEARLRAFLANPHPGLMPPVGLGTREIESVLAYMRALRAEELAEGDSSTSRASP